MKEIVVISGKGGTGKTSLTAAFAALASNVVLADCDVDAADLHLVIQPDIVARHEFISGNEAHITPQACTGCGRCAATCRFGAVERCGDTAFRIDAGACEGCGACLVTCAAEAIDLVPRRCGEWYESETRFGPMVHARLDSGAENSGKLVTAVREAARARAAALGADLILVDGPPGVGCPVIASITGAQAVVAVAEPSLSGRHDLERVAKLTRHFAVPLFVCINKWDINPDMSAELSAWAERECAGMLGTVTWDRAVTQAQIEGRSVVEAAYASVAAAEMKAIWEELCRKIP